MPTTKQTILSNAYHNFIIHIRNTETRYIYTSRLDKFFKYCQVESYDDLLFSNESKLIQSKITDFLIHLQVLGLSSATVRQHITALKFFYVMNDITNLNWKKVSKVVSGYKKVANDRPYTTNEITKMLEKADQRGRVIILLMCSSGMRQGAIHSLKVVHLERIPQYNIYKITVYKNEPEEYITFCSSECAKAIDSYLEYRKRYGEIIKSYSPLIREQFDKTDPIQCSTPKEVGIKCVENIIYRIINDSGIREKKNIVKGERKKLHEVMQSHGLRKFFNTSVIEAGMPPLYAEFLMGHKTGLAIQSYVKPTISQMLDEYMKIVDSVTIAEENRLKRQVETLKIDKSKMEQVIERINLLENKILNQQ
ncbi:MAG TPA: site-specific integrase [Nitrososphaeraceae archaeon]|nr:site-specific integrase [Nitrososphaeraceae archaeon]